MYVRKNFQNVCMYIFMHVCKNVVCMYVCMPVCAEHLSHHMQYLFLQYTDFFMLYILGFFKNRYTNLKLHQNHTTFCFNTHVLL